MQIRVSIYDSGTSGKGVIFEEAIGENAAFTMVRPSLDTYNSAPLESWGRADG